MLPLDRQVLHVPSPAQCLIGGRLVGRPGTLCAGCWRIVDFIERPACVICGLPIDDQIGDDAECAVCLPDDEGARRRIVGLKGRDGAGSAEALAGLLARSGADVIRGSDATTPVPLHWPRLIGHRHGHAALRAKLWRGSRESP